jgi:hypothetical protein
VNGRRMGGEVKVEVVKVVKVVKAKNKEWQVSKEAGDIEQGARAWSMEHGAWSMEKRIRNIHT